MTPLRAWGGKPLAVGGKLAGHVRCCCYDLGTPNFDYSCDYCKDAKTPDELIVVLPELSGAMEWDCDDDWCKQFQGPYVVTKYGETHCRWEYLFPGEGDPTCGDYIGTIWFNWPRHIRVGLRYHATYGYYILVEVGWDHEYHAYAVALDPDDPSAANKPDCCRWSNLEVPTIENDDPLKRFGGTVTDFYCVRNGPLYLSSLCYIPT